MSVVAPVVSAPIPAVPGEIVPLTVTDPAAVPVPFSVAPELTVTALPDASEPVRLNTDAEVILVAPVYVFAPESVSVPVLVSAPEPEMTPLELPPATVKV